MNYQKENESLWISYRILNNLLESKIMHNFFYKHQGNFKQSYFYGHMLQMDNF